MLAFFQALGGVLEERDDMLDGVFHAVKIGKRRVTFDDLVGEDARQARVQGGVDQLGFADGHQQAFGGGGVGGRVGFAQFQVFLKAVLFLPGGFKAVLKMTENAHDSTSQQLRPHPPVAQVRWVQTLGMRSGASGQQPARRALPGDGMS